MNMFVPPFSSLHLLGQGLSHCTMEARNWTEGAPKSQGVATENNNTQCHTRTSIHWGHRTSMFGRSWFRSWRWCYETSWIAELSLWKLIHQPGNFQNRPTSLVVSSSSAVNLVIAISDINSLGEWCRVCSQIPRQAAENPLFGRCDGYGDPAANRSALGLASWITFAALCCAWISNPDMTWWPEVTVLWTLWEAQSYFMVD